MKKTPKILKDFQTFAIHGNAMELAIAVAIGAAFTAVITALVEYIITPIIGAFFSTNFARLTLTIHGSTFSYGLVLNALFTFLMVAASLFFFVVVPLNALRHRFRPDPTPVPMAPCPSCTTSIVQAARRCPFCTEVLGDNWVPAS